jgi:beta-lactamase superfamily II metal-dependent hydrolase
MTDEQKKFVKEVNDRYGIILSSSQRNLFEFPADTKYERVIEIFNLYAKMFPK